MTGFGQVTCLRWMGKWLRRHRAEQIQASRGWLWKYVVVKTHVWDGHVGLLEVFLVVGMTEYDDFLKRFRLS